MTHLLLKTSCVPSPSPSEAYALRRISTLPFECDITAIPSNVCQIRSTIDNIHNLFVQRHVPLHPCGTGTIIKIDVNKFAAWDEPDYTSIALTNCIAIDSEFNTTFPSAITPATFRVEYEEDAESLIVDVAFDFSTAIQIYRRNVAHHEEMSKLISTEKENGILVETQLIKKVFAESKANENQSQQIFLNLKSSCAPLPLQLASNTTVQRLMSQLKHLPVRCDIAFLPSTNRELSNSHDVFSVVDFVRYEQQSFFPCGRDNVISVETTAVYQSKITISLTHCNIVTEDNSTFPISATPATLRFKQIQNNGQFNTITSRFSDSHVTFELHDAVLGYHKNLILDGKVVGLNRMISSLMLDAIFLLVMGAIIYSKFISNKTTSVGLVKRRQSPSNGDGAYIDQDVDIPNNDDDHILSPRRLFIQQSDESIGSQECAEGPFFYNNNSPNSGHTSPISMSKVQVDNSSNQQASRPASRLEDGSYSNSLTHHVTPRRQYRVERTQTEVLTKKLHHDTFFRTSTSPRRNNLFNKCLADAERFNAKGLNWQSALIKAMENYGKEKMQLENRDEQLRIRVEQLQKDLSRILFNRKYIFVALISKLYWPQVKIFKLYSDLLHRTTYPWQIIGKIMNTCSSNCSEVTSTMRMSWFWYVYSNDGLMCKMNCFADSISEHTRPIMMACILLAFYTFCRWLSGILSIDVSTVFLVVSSPIIASEFFPLIIYGCFILWLATTLFVSPLVSKGKNLKLIDAQNHYEYWTPICEWCGYGVAFVIGNTSEYFFTLMLEIYEYKWV